MYDMSKIAIANPKEWYYSVLTIEDTHVITKEDVQKEIEEGIISEDVALQEYYGSYDCGAEGSYYAKYIQDMRLKNRITQVPWDPSQKVHSSWDLGVHDKTCIIMWQTDSKSVRIIDYYENKDKGLDHYVNILRNKPYVWGSHFAPHDINIMELGSGLTRLEMARNLGIKLVVLPKISIDDGIELAKLTFNKLWIDESLTKLIKSLESYRRKFDSEKNRYDDRPFHDEHSDRADSYRYMCMALSRVREGLSPESLDKMYHESMMGKGQFNSYDYF